MSSTVSWNLQLAVRDGQLDAFKSLMVEMVESTRSEQGTLVYEWFLSEDGTICHLYERYADSEAALVHLGNFGSKFAERFLACADPTALYAYGNPEAQAREVLASFNAVFLGTLGGFAR
jgi:quinol monooxygenase YgiN